VSKAKFAATILFIFVAITLAAAVGYIAGARDSAMTNQHSGLGIQDPGVKGRDTARSETASNKAAARGERKPLYWHDPMYPQHRFDKPGRSPFMDMDLIPVYEEEVDSEGVVSIDPRIAQNLGVRTASVERETFSQHIDAVGSVHANERDIQVVQSRASGWVERLHVRAAGEPVKRGQLLAEVYAPDLLAAQEEFLLASKMENDRLASAARARLSLLGLNETQIARLEKTRAPQRRVALYSPLNGIVAELGVREGTEVAPGTAMFNLVDLSSVWVIAEIPETQAGSISEGGSAEITIPAFPGKVYEGRVDYVYPRLDKTTRTLEARIVLKNPELKLKPGMYADVRLQGEEVRDVLTVPTEAVIRTGRRSVVLLALAEGRFKPVEVTTGFEAEGKTQILDGLEKGQKVVASGQFLIDSTSSLRTALDRLTAPEADAASADPKTDSMKKMMERSSTKEMTSNDPPQGATSSDSKKGAQEGKAAKEVTGSGSMKRTQP
jgi:Cu(I)/Ag(I) efflux system membrane fusion protein